MPQVELTRVSMGWPTSLSTGRRESSSLPTMRIPWWRRSSRWRATRTFVVGSAPRLRRMLASTRPNGSVGAIPHPAESTTTRDAAGGVR